MTALTLAKATNDREKRPRKVAPADGNDFIPDDPSGALLMLRGLESLVRRAARRRSERR